MDSSTKKCVNSRLTTLVKCTSTADCVSNLRILLGRSTGITAFVFTLILSSLLASAPVASHAGSLPTVTITKVTADTSSVKIQFTPVAGAVDYRVYDVSDPTNVKYAGTSINQDMWDNYINTTPKTSIEWNEIAPGQSETLVVQAVNAQGPFPQGNLYNSDNKPQFPAAQDSLSLLGSNQGMTLDGNFSTNGQGTYTNVPVVIAQSAPFTVTPTGLGALPSSSDATQVNFDDFPSATFTAPVVTNAGLNEETFTMQSILNWTIQTDRADIDNTKLFVMNHHFMDVLFDGGTYEQGPSSMHTGHGAMFMSPQNTVDFSNGQVLHATMEVDGMFDPRRWCQIFIAPSNDPINQFDDQLGPMNNSGNVLTFQITNKSYNVELLGKDANGNETVNDIIDNAGSPVQWTVRTQNGYGLDDRTRFDLFVSQNHVQIYENGVCVGDDPIPGGMPFTNARVYFSHYCYHTAQEVEDLLTYGPYEKFWLNQVPFSDERHWSNMGFEVLPASESWATMATHINETAQLPAQPSSNSGTGSGSGSGSGSGNGGTTPTVPTTQTVNGMIATIEENIGSAETLTVNTQNGSTYLLTTTNTTLGAQAMGACLASSRVTVTYTPITATTGIAQGAATKRAGSNGTVVSITVTK